MRRIACSPARGPSPNLRGSCSTPFPVPYLTVPRAVLGRSLSEDDKESFQRVDELFTTRNRIAHRGEKPNPAVVQSCLSGSGLAPG